jgi:hypothetical protein
MSTSSVGRSDQIAVPHEIQRSDHYRFGLDVPRGLLVAVDEVIE